MRFWPCSSVSPVRNTAASSCIAFCIARRSIGGRRAALGVAESVEARQRLVAGALGQILMAADRRRSSLAACMPAALPNTTRSISELEPSRLAPCTETQAASPTAIRPGTTVSGLPSFSVSASPV